jgi:glutamyl-tRNA synthetase
MIEAEWKKAGVTPQNTDSAWLHSTIDLIKSRARNLRDFAAGFRAFFTDDYANDPAAVEKFLKDASVREMLAELADRYASSNGFSEQSAEQVLRDLAAEKNVKAGALINGARVALTGQAVAPSLFAVMLALGKEKTIERLAAANR